MKESKVFYNCYCYIYKKLKKNHDKPQNMQFYDLLGALWFLKLFVALAILNKYFNENIGFSFDNKLCHFNIYTNNKIYISRKCFTN